MTIVTRPMWDASLAAIGVRPDRPIWLALVDEEMIEWSMRRVAAPLGDFHWGLRWPLYYRGTRERRLYVGVCGTPAGPIGIRSGFNVSWVVPPAGSVLIDNLNMNYSGEPDCLQEARVLY